jgi:hypothetical protein
VGLTIASRSAPSFLANAKDFDYIFRRSHDTTSQAVKTDI